jgi:hypothetical protein
MTSIEGEQKHFYRLIDLVNATPQINWIQSYLIYNPRINIYDSLQIISNISDSEKKSILIKYLTLNPNITIDFIRSVPPSLNLSEVIEYSKISLLDISKNLDIKWDKLYLAFRYNKHTSNDDNNLIPILFSDITYIIKKSEFEYTEDIDIDINKNNENIKIWNILSTNVNMDYIVNHLQLPWIYKNFTVNNSLRLRHIKILKDKTKFNIEYLSTILPLQELLLSEYKIDYSKLSKNPSLTSDYFLEHLDEKWNGSTLDENKNLNFDIIADSIKLDVDIVKNFDFDTIYLYDNPKMTLKFMIRFFRYIPVYLYKTIQKSGIIKLTDMQLYPVLNILLTTNIQYNPNLNIDFLLAQTKNLNWDWKNTVALEYLNLTDLNKIIPFLNIYEKFYYISTNKNLTYDFIYKYKDLLYWNNLLLSSFAFPAEVNKEQIINRIKNNYLNQKKQVLLKQYMISDLNNIIMEY